MSGLEQLICHLKETLVMRNAFSIGTVVLVAVLLIGLRAHTLHTSRLEEVVTRDKQAASAAIDKPEGTTSPYFSSFGSAPDLRGKPATVFTLKDMKGKVVSLSDLKGKPVLLNFWATWCGPCKVEMPWFQELQQKYGAQGLQVVGINQDDEDRPDTLKQKITDTTRNLGITYPILLSDHKVGDAYGGLEMLPATFYIDKNGFIRAEAIGLANKGEADANVQKLLQGSSS